MKKNLNLDKTLNLNLNLEKTLNLNLIWNLEKKPLKEEAVEEEDI